MEFYKETEFRKTEIGRIPKDWNIESVKDIADVKGGKRLPKGDKLVEYKTAFPYIRILDFTGGKLIVDGIKYLHPSTQRKISRYIISSEDVYISIAGTIGLAGLIPKELDGANLTENAAKLCNLRKVEKAFLAYLLNSANLQSQIKALIGKGSQPKLALFRIEKLLVPVPSLSEQKNISRLLLLVDKAIDISDVIIKKTQELKKGLMQELLTKGIGQKEFKYSEELGCESPIEWEVRRLEDVCDILDNQRIPLNGKARRGMQGDIPYYGANGVLDFINDFIFDDKLILIAEDGGYFDEYATRSIAYMVEGKCWVNNHAHVLKVKENEGFVTEFVLYSLEHKNIIPYIKGSTRSKLNQNELRILPVGMPKLKKEQEEIASIFSNVDNKIEEEKRTKQYLEKIKKGLMQIVLTGQVRIKVN